jgi:N-acetylglutamate synthase-like GNAT family acetyltransferase
VDKVIAGFAACIILSDGVLIEKIGVKNPYRLQGVSASLLVSVHRLAHEQEWPNVLSLTVPETFVIPGLPEDITGWLVKAGFKMKPPFHPNFFEINEEPVDGVPCIYEG